MRALFAILILVFSTQAEAVERIIPCVTQFVRTPSGISSYEVQLVSENNKGDYTMRIFKNLAAQRTMLPSVAIYYEADGELSKFMSVQTGKAVMVYRERASSTREGAVRITDGSQRLFLNMTCYLRF